MFSHNKKNLNLWYYPLERAKNEPDEVIISDLIVLCFEIKVLADEHLPFHFTVKAPLNIKLGDLFRSFIDDYNELHPNKIIRFIDEKHEPFGWKFFISPSFFKIRKILDPGRTIRENRLKENDLITVRKVITKV